MMRRMSCIELLMIIIFNIYSNTETRDIVFNKKSFDICDEFFNTTNCYYFACIDSIYQCGEGNLLVQFSYLFCKLVLFYFNKKKTPFSSGGALLALTYKSLTQSDQICLIILNLNFFIQMNY